MTLPVKEDELWHQVSVAKNGADTTLVVDRASRTLRSNGDHSIKAALGVDPGDPEGSASGGTGSGGSSSKQYGPRKDSDSMAFGDLYSNGYVFVGGLPSWYSEKMDSVVLPTTLLEPRLRGSVRSLKYRDMRSSSERQQDMMAYKVRNLFGFLLHFVAFFHVASLLSTGVDNEKVGVDNEKALELTNSTVFHRGSRQ